MDDCIFCKIIKGEIPSTKVGENEKFYAFYDINPATKIHVLVIPKTHVQSIAHLTEDNKEVVADMFLFIRDIAAQLGMQEDGYRVVLNTGEKAGQTVPHLHAHILGGQTLNWPGI